MGKIVRLLGQTAILLEKIAIFGFGKKISGAAAPDPARGSAPDPVY